MRIFKTRRLAVQYGKDRLRQMLGVKNLSCHIVNINGHCDCGETTAVSIDSMHENKPFKTISVAFCKNCGESV